MRSIAGNSEVFCQMLQLYESNLINCFLVNYTTSNIHSNSMDQLTQAIVFTDAHSIALLPLQCHTKEIYKKHTLIQMTIIELYKLVLLKISWCLLLVQVCAQMTYTICSE